MAPTPLPVEIQGMLLTQSLGESLAIWARVEDELSLIFINAIGAQQDTAARAVFYAVRSFEARLSVTQAAVGAIWPPLPGLIAAEWNALSNLLTRKAKARNALAHGGILELSINDGPTNAYIDPFLNVTGGRMVAKAENLLSVKQVQEKGDGFSKLALRVSAFEMMLALHLKRQPKSLLRVNHPDPAVRAQANQTPQEHPKPPESSQA